MKKISRSYIKRVFFDLLAGAVAGVVFFGVLFAISEPFMSKCECSYRKDEKSYLVQNKENKTVMVVSDEKENVQETVVEHHNRVFLGEFKLTAYCSCHKCCDFWAYSRPIDENGNDIVIGANGERLYQGVSIAVDPEVIPYDSKVYIDGKEYIAHDRGGAIKGNRIDVYFDNHQDALDFGVQYASVEVDG